MHHTNTITLFFLLFTLLHFNYALNDKITQKNTNILSQPSILNQNLNRTSQGDQKSRPKSQTQVLSSQLPQNFELRPPKLSHNEQEITMEYLVAYIIEIFWMYAILGIQILGLCLLLHTLYKMMIKKWVIVNPPRQQNHTQARLDQSIT